MHTQIKIFKIITTITKKILNQTNLINEQNVTLIFLSNLCGD